MKPYLVLTIVTIICTGCATMESEFKKACDDNTIAAYQRYLQKYPDSKFETDARNRVEELEWAKTIDEKSVWGYETYLRKYPLGKYRDEANRRLGDDKWKSIKANSDPTSRELYEAAKNYIEQQPTGAYASEAQSTLKNYVTHSVGNVMETPELNKRQLKKTDSIVFIRFRSNFILYINTMINQGTNLLQKIYETFYIKYYWYVCNFYWYRVELITFTYY